MSIRIKRILAFLIDWNITLLPFILSVYLVLGLSMKEDSVAPLGAILAMLLILAAPVVFVLRDVIFKGRSLGKRLFGLRVYDKKTLQESTAKQRLLRNVFLFILFVDGIILLATGESVGDMAAGTVVLSEKSLEAYRTAPANAGSSGYIPTEPKRKDFLKVPLIIALALAALIGIALIALNASKGTEEYAVAYSYFISSKAFEDTGAQESQIWMNRYSSTTYSSASEDSVTQTVRIGFIVDFKYYEVVCHKENGLWSVCSDCTSFD